MKSSQSIPFKCQTSTAPTAHKEIIERPWREAKRTWLMFHLISPLAQQPCPREVWWPSGLRLHRLPRWQQEKGNKEAKNIKWGDIRNGVAGKIVCSASTVGLGLMCPEALTEPGLEGPACSSPGGTTCRITRGWPRLVSFHPSEEAWPWGDLKLWFFHVRLALTEPQCGKNTSGCAFPLNKSTSIPQPPVTCPLHTHSRVPPLSCPQMPFFWH